MGGGSVRRRADPRGGASRGHAQPGVDLAAPAAAQGRLLARRTADGPARAARGGRAVSAQEGARGAGRPALAPAARVRVIQAHAPALAFVTLGCPKNTVDSEHMLGLLVRDGFRTVADP